ncbi:MAG: hypothetical protein R3F45_10025 [Gammaproteobacteria bacterium]
MSPPWAGIAYQYGSAGTLAGPGATPMQGNLVNSGFGVAPQTLQSLASLQTGMVRLA